MREGAGTERTERNGIEECVGEGGFLVGVCAVALLDTCSPCNNEKKGMRGSPCQKSYRLVICDKECSVQARATV